MTRLEKAIEISNDTHKQVIIDNHCPSDIDPKLPGYVSNTYIFGFRKSRFLCICSGITCEECWNKELEEH